MTDYEDIPNSQIEHLINEYVHNERNRAILRRRFIDGITFERLAEEFDLSVTQINTIVRRDGDRVLKRL